MKTLFLGAGPIGRLYAYRFYKAGKDVTILARNITYIFIKENGIVLVDGYTGEKDSTKVNVVDKLDAQDNTHKTLYKIMEEGNNMKELWLNQDDYQIGGIIC